MQKRLTILIVGLAFLTAFAVVPAFSQTLTIGTIDPGPYGPGSTIAVPFHINDVSGCIATTNTFKLYMSDASGNFTSTTPVATVSGFYATFLNYTIPGTFSQAGNYKFMVTATSPAISSNASATVPIGTIPGIIASASSSSINATYPGVFGQCNGGGSGAPYTFINNTTGASAVGISFFNESTQAFEATNQNISASSYTFNAASTNYTVITKAVNSAGVVGTYAYQLINNQVSTNVGFTGNPSVCITGGVAPLTYNIDYTSATGIQNNYPGNTYDFSWGDGSATTVLTFCQIKALNGQVTHNYTKASCGNTANGQVNSFEVNFSANNTYCGRIGSEQTSYAKIVISPLNYYLPIATACTNTPVVFMNASITGPDPNATTSSCAENPNALYTWIVDGNVIKQNYTHAQNFVYTFTTNGTHNVTLRAQSTGGNCNAPDYTASICIQNPPQPLFTLPSGTYCSSTGPFTPVNTSVVDNTCNTSTYTWMVTPNTFTYSGNTNANSQQPQFNFTAPGTYTIKLAIVNQSCGDTSAAQTLVVVSSPVAQLSSNFSKCGNQQTLTFDNTSGSATQTILTGTPVTTPTTYTWTVTGDPGYSFVNGTTANSKYPQILFNNFATYTVTVTHQNSCGSVSSSQQITFLQAPTVIAGNPQTICQGSVVHLTGSIAGSYISSQWVGGSGTFSSSNTTTTDYTPSAADVANGSVNLILQATTSLPSPCNLVTSSVTITIIPTDVITSAAAKAICSGQSVNYNITASNPASSFSWTAAVTSGAATGFTPAGTSSNINDAITNSNPVNTAAIAYTIIPQSNGCTGTPFTFTVTIPGVPVATATAANAGICSNQPVGITLSSNLFGTTYTWTATAPAGVTGYTNVTSPTSITAIQDVLVNNTNAPIAVNYTVTPYNSNGCPGAPVLAPVTVYPVPVTANAGNSISLCNVSSYTLQANSPGTGTGLWTVLSGSGLTFSDNTSPITMVSGLLPGNIYQLQWTIGTGPGCQSSSAITITVNIPTVGGKTTANSTAPVCSGGNSGQITLSGQLGNVLRWESSITNGTSWQTITNTTTTQPYINLTQTTLYRAIVQNGACNIMPSDTTTITVNPVTPVANAGSNQSLCGATTAVLNGNNPGAFAGIWHQTSGPAVTFADSTLFNTAVTGLVGGNTYTFLWTIKGLAPCPNTQSLVTVVDNPDVTPSFTASTKVGCGNLTVQFTNTSTNQLAGTTFVWNFGDGSALSNAVGPQHVFPQRTDGKDTTYHITLAVSGNCLQRPPFVDSVVVRPATPVAQILPNSLSGCGNFSLVVQNISPGNNLTYDFYLYQGSTLIQKITKTDKSSAVFNPITTTIRTSYNLYMIATGYCNNTAESTHIPITITPVQVTAQMFIQNNINSGCQPLNLVFYNNSAGGDNFHYNIYNINNQIIDQPLGGTAPLPYVLDSVGTFYVSITASNACGTNESPKTRIDVYAIPTPDFVADNTGGCKNIVVHFTNKTISNDPKTLPTSLIYDWDFGDGSTHSTSYNPPAHSYNFGNSPYTVTLTATNTTSGCSNVTVKKSYISITGPPITQFTAKPDTITSIPNYTFSFVDETTGSPASWQWVFSDGQSSTKQDPTITFPDTGTYKVTLTTANATGCDSTISHKVQITGIPGQLYLPNAFIPTSLSQDLRMFMAKGSGIKIWHLQIFNNYGQLVWETTKLDSKGAPVDGWDGTFKGTLAPQGVYVWQASATFINGTEWKGNSINNSLPKRTGSVHLIR